MQISRKLSKVFLILGLAGTIASVPASADPVLYSNGPASTNNPSYLVNDGYWLTNSFTLSQNSTVTGADFSIFITNDPDSLTTVDYAITTAPFGGTTEASGTVSPAGAFTGTISSPPWDTYNESFSIPSLNLDAGTYWLELYDGVTAEGGEAAWDNINGPSVAFLSFSGIEGENINGLILSGSNSEAFDIYGTTNSATPEPSSLVLLGSGLAMLAGAARRRLRGGIDFRRGQTWSTLAFHLGANTGFGGGHVKSGPKIMAISALVVLATAAKADPIVATTPLNVVSYSFYVFTQAPTGAAQVQNLQQTTLSEDTFITSINAPGGGVNAYGNTYAGTAMAEGGGGSFSLFASSSLVGGSVSPLNNGVSAGAAFSGVGAGVFAGFIVPAGVFSMTETITTDGSGISSTGSGSAGSYGAIIISDSEVGESWTYIGLDGGTQTFSAEFATTPGEYAEDQWFVDAGASSFEPGDSAVFNYWGTFTSSFAGYDANGNLVGQYDLPSPTATPEPSTLMLLGSGLLGLAGVVRRRLPRSGI